MTATQPPARTGAARILIVDDHPMVREGLATWISKQPDLECCGQAEDVSEALQLVKAMHPDLVIVDISLKTGHGIDLIKQIKASNDRIKMLVSSMHDESLYARRALQAGAMGYINKQEMPEKVIEAIRTVLDGKRYLSPEMTDRVLRDAVRRGGTVEGSPAEVLSDRELEIFELIGQGLTTGAIARRLHRSVHTIDTHREKIKKKLNLRDGAELNHRAVRWLFENS